MMEDYINKYCSKGIIIDTNLLLLLLYVSGISQDYIQKLKRSRKYTIEDYRALLIMIDRFNKVVVTPNILTEVRNLANGLYDDVLKQFYMFFAQSLSIVSERYMESISVSKIPGLHVYGLTDIGIISLAKEKYLVLIDDLRFASFAIDNGIDVINFNYIRELAWDIFR